MEAIDLISFLKNYYGIYHEDLSYDTLTHEDVLKLFPNVKICVGKVLYEDILLGNVINVYDRYKRTVYYYNPHLNIDKLNIDIKEKEKEDTEIEISSEELKGLSKEELLKIRRKLRLNNQRKKANMVNAMIKKIKKKEPKKYRKEKEELLIKEKMNYD